MVALRLSRSRPSIASDVVSVPASLIYPQQPGWSPGSSPNTQARLPQGQIATAPIFSLQRGIQMPRSHSGLFWLPYLSCNTSHTYHAHTHKHFVPPPLLLNFSPLHLYQCFFRCLSPHPPDYKVCERRDFHVLFITYPQHLNQCVAYSDCTVIIV